MKAIEFIKVKKDFNDGGQIVHALHETNFSIEAGEFVAIIGPSGSGKSTFLTLAGGLQSPDSGKVLINGEKFSKEKEKVRAKIRFNDVGFVLQTSNLIPFLTVKKQFELIDRISKKKPKISALDLLKSLGIDKLSDKYPRDLSGGERQRVAIAKAMYNDPFVILADEPTASLDSERAYEVVELLAKEAKDKNKAIIMVTHDVRLVELCDKVYEMKDGILSIKNKG